MTDLQMSLAGLVGVFVLAIFIYGKWREHSFRKKIDTTLDNNSDDVLLRSSELAGNEARVEPVFDADTNASSQSAGSDIESVMPIQTDRPRDLPIDEIIDCMLTIELDLPTKADRILQEISDFKFIGKRAIHFMGQNVEGVWECISVGKAYTSVFAGIQMVDRSGHLTEIEFSEFVSKLRQLAESLNAHVEIPDMHKIVEKARELHHFVTEHDAQLSISVASKGADWDLQTLIAVLEKIGFDQRTDGKLMMPDGDGGSLFVVSTHSSPSESTTRRLSFLLDVPRVTPSRNAFESMVKCANTLAGHLNGVLVDDNNQSISSQALDDIRGQVQEFYLAMEESQIPAGSIRAQRLFS